MSIETCVHGNWEQELGHWGNQSQVNLFFYGEG